MTGRLRKVVCVAAVATIAATMPAGAAGFLDDLANALFGRPRPRPMIAIEPYDPLNVTVKPRRKRAAAEVASKPKPPVVKLDPQRDPDWYLKDPTLRRGDVVVTARGVLVYQGRDSDHMIEGDFTALGGKPGEKSWKGQLQAAAAGGRSFFRDFRDAPPSPADISLVQPTVLRETAQP
ncbi:hypothetical protein FQV39_13165 [Bosea sp. F3-2]|uniref:hypothetical protein n=1 Tax=Bosea sp. F3-2 TaxID=2599640 RepID=UPI0011F08B44|nr:hypothetical protein [Bosea sp. F3-2]QEL23421.1 hypothetical protein FQV39_13165 [Bosea sp. F3-2]